MVQNTVQELPGEGFGFRQVWVFAFPTLQPLPGLNRGVLPDTLIRISKEEITKAMKSAPFRPFTVRLADGSQVQILSADHAHVSPSGRTLVVSEEDGTRLIDTSLILEVKTTEAA